MSKMHSISSLLFIAFVMHTSAFTNVCIVSQSGSIDQCHKLLTTSYRISKGFYKVEYFAAFDKIPIILIGVERYFKSGKHFNLLLVK